MWKSQTAVSGAGNSSSLIRRASTAAAAAVVLGATLSACGLGSGIDAPDAACGTPLPSRLMLPEDITSFSSKLDVYGVAADGQTYRFGEVKAATFSLTPEVSLKDTCGDEMAKGKEQLRFGSTVDDVFVAGQDGRADRNLEMRKQTWDSAKCAFVSGGHKACSVYEIKEGDDTLAVSVKSGESTGTGGVTFQLRDPQTGTLMANVTRGSNTLMGHHYEIDVMNPEIPNELPVLIAGLKTLKDNADS